MRHLTLRRSMRWVATVGAALVVSVTLAPGAAADAERFHSDEHAAEDTEPNPATTDASLVLQSTPGSFTAVAAGASHTCAIRANQAIICWGLSFSRQTHAPFGWFTDVAAGGLHSCAIRTSQSVICWGDNQHGQTDAPSGAFTAVAAGGSHSCAIRTSQSVICWGDNQHGQTDAPTGTFTAVAAGASHTCGVSADESVICWGDNQYGKADAPSHTFTAVAAGGSHTCAIGFGRRVACWGDNRHGMTLARAGLFTAVAAGESHTCGLLADQSITCWGDRHYKTDVPVIRVSRSSSSIGVHDRSIDALRSNYRDIFHQTGCVPLTSCQHEPLQRWEMAVWLVRILDRDLAHTYRAAPGFRDVRGGYWWSRYPGRLAQIGVTKGCSADPVLFCPMDNVTRGQMASFLERAFDLEPAPSAGFADTQDNVHEADIDALFAAGITVGCNTDSLQFCPQQFVSRGEMATFLARALRIL